MPIPEEARKVLRRRVERCTRAARRALVLMAQSDRADIPSLASAAQLPSERLRPLVDELRRAGLVTELEDGSFVLENPILYEEVSNGEIFNSGS